MRAIDKAIVNGLNYLSLVQTAEGAFVTQYSSRGEKFVVEEEVVTTFAPALVLQALAKVDKAKTIREGIVSWLQKQQSQTGAFNYWPADSVFRQARPYPDDLDDTACALAGIYLHNPALIGSNQLAQLVRLLIASETVVGGPYNTWLVDTTDLPAWQDIDLAVNCNIDFLLQHIAEPLPKLQFLIDTAVARQDFRSSYYPDKIVVQYFIARVCRSSTTKLTLSDLLHENDSLPIASPMYAALKITALRKLGDMTDLSKLVEYLLQSQQTDGSWPAERIWLDRAENSKMYAGSSALTTAFVVEALNLSLPAAIKRQAASTDSRLESSFRVARNRLSQLPTPLAGQTCSMLDALKSGNNAHEVALLPYIFADSLKGKPVLSDAVLSGLSVATIFGWLAYDAYDDLLDEGGEPLKLPAANAVMRLSLHGFLTTKSDQQFQRLVGTIFDRIDAANAWEVANCRIAYDDLTVTIGNLPKYPSATFLAERSIGHALAPLAVLAVLGKDADDIAVQHFFHGFRHYLVARQLNDDLHDWEEDLMAGRISYVVVRLLRETSVMGRHSKAVLAPKLERHFWHHTLKKLCAETTTQLQKSRQNFTNSGLLQDENLFLRFVLRLEQAIARTLEEQQRAQDFLNNYTNKNSR